ncbi:MAG TPA: flagellar hook-basal body complex protein [bacterium]|jgi:flagellar hook protein FlgE|nr:flagellar hook-basal body complex protein [bacterium]
MSAFGAAISGLQSSEQWLTVISNNVANSQTVGFKAGQLNFADLISQDLSSPSGDNSNANLGGIDAEQVGLGVTVGDIATDLTQGSIQTTGNVTDIAIQGQGYLTVKSGEQNLYTRAGNLTFDSNGDLVTAEGGLVQGWSLTETINPAPLPDVTPGGVTDPQMTVISRTLNTTNTSDIGDIVIPNNLQLAPLATSDNLDPNNQALGVSLAGNLDSSTPDTANNLLAAAGVDSAAPPATAANISLLTQNANATSNFTVYDSLGTPSNFTIYWYQTAATPGAQASWSYYIYDTTGGAAPSDTAVFPTPGAFIASGGAAGAAINDTVNASGDPSVSDSTFTGPVTFNNDGSLATNGSSAPGENPTITLSTTDGSMLPFTFSINLGTPNIVADDAAAPPIAASWGLSNGLTGDYGNGTTNPTTGVYTPVQSIYTKSVDGYSEGTLTGLSFNNTGGVEGTFSNGQTIVVAQLALTNFTNPGGLENIGGNYFSSTDNSGSAQIGTAGSVGLGTIQGGALEESNVSLSTELTNMILAQNMYQANAKVITTQATLFTDLFQAIPQQ